MKRRSAFLSPASLSALTALLLLVVVALVMGDDVLPARRVGDAVTIIWLLSAAGLVLGAVLAFADVRRLVAEGAALDALERLGLDQFVSQERGGRRERLAEHRARQVQRVRDEEGVPPYGFQERLRREAGAELAPVASTTRFLASALLLLAVLGTFAGMKSALPPLIEKIKAAVASETVPAGATTTPTTSQNFGIGDTLTPVSDAFGANFLALLGSLALGIAAFGAAAERSRFLRRLEQVSDERLYDQLGRPTQRAQSALETAIHDLSGHAGAIARVGDHVNKLGGDLGFFRTELVEALRGLEQSFSSALQIQKQGLETELKQTLGTVVNHLSTIAGVLGQTAGSYNALIKGLEERDLGVTQAAATLKETAGELKKSATSLVKETTASAETLAQSFSQAGGTIARAVETGSTRLANAAEEMADVNQQAGENAARLAQVVSDTAARVKELHDQLTSAAQQSAAAILSIPGRLEAAARETIILREAVVALEAGLLLALTGIREDITAGVESLREPLVLTQGGVEALRAPIAAVQESVDALREPLVATQGGVEALRAPITAVQGSVDALREPLVATQGGVEALRAPIIAVQESVDALREPLAAARSSVEALRGPLVATQGGIEALRVPITAVQESVDALRDPLDATRSGVESLREPLVLTQSGVEALRAPIAAVRNSVDALREPLAATQSGVEALREPLGLTRTGVEALHDPVREAATTAAEALTLLDRLLREIAAAVGRRDGSSG